MRITQAAREETRLRILDVAREQFRSGYAEVTTRAIASQAGIAAGTLFNYFPSKEALAFAMVVEASGAAESEFDAQAKPSTLAETLFSYVAIQLRHLDSMRAWTPEVFESALSPLRAAADDGPGEFRRQHLERVHAWIEEELGSGADRSIELHLYWSLYLGVISFWARDETDNQTATLALLDRSMRLFCHTLNEEKL